MHLESVMLTLNMKSKELSVSVKQAIIRLIIKIAIRPIREKAETLGLAKKKPNPKLFGILIKKIKKALWSNCSR